MKLSRWTLQVVAHDTCRHYIEMSARARQYTLEIENTMWNILDDQTQHEILTYGQSCGVSITVIADTL